MSIRQVLSAVLFAFTMSWLMGSHALAESPEQWYRDGEAAVANALKRRPITTRAKNVILFIGDGMSVSTVTGARILDGQQHGHPGEENLLSFERLPYTGVIKTYTTNAQTPDSAGTMTAIITGVKTKSGVLSVNQNVVVGDPKSVEGNRLTTLLELAARRGRWTGVVTTARVTHATPAACYAHTPDRSWEDDSHVERSAPGSGFPDIARQLLDDYDIHPLRVLLGGGREQFLPHETHDPEYPKRHGHRRDGRDLTKEWRTKDGAAYVWNLAQFNAVDVKTTDRLLGLFEPSHMHFETDRANVKAGEPSLAQMTAKAIDLLSPNKSGFVLMVEGARIDHAHHAANAYRALTDTIAFARAVQTAIDKTDRTDTLIVVTADHSHVFTLGGYATRGNPILGKVVTNDARGNPGTQARDMTGLPYTTAGYANGPGYTGKSSRQEEGLKTFPHKLEPLRGDTYDGITKGRPKAIETTDTTAPNYLQECTIPLAWESHSAEDVVVYADGPMAHLFSGVHEQNYIFHVMIAALGIDTADSGPRSDLDLKKPQRAGSIPTRQNK